MTEATAQRIVDKSLETGKSEDQIAAAKAAMLDTFLDYDDSERARVWRAMDEISKNTLISAMLIRKYNDWSDTSVALWVSRYNQRWGF